MKKLLFSLLAVLLLNVTSYAQLTEGKVKMEITEASSEDQQMAMGISMLKGTEILLYFSGEQTLTVMDMMGGMMKMKNYANPKTDRMDMLMEAMGSKIWVSGLLSDSKDMKKQPGIEKAKITYDKSDTKEFLGYKAHKVTITMPDMEDMAITGYVTDEIKADAGVIQGLEGLNLKGFPLEFTVNSPKMKITITTTEIEKTIDKSIFNPVTEGYTKMSMDEFSKSMGGMSGGLGF